MEDTKQQLRTFIDNVISGDLEAATAAFQPYVAQKSKDMIAKARQLPTISESIEALNEFTGDSPIKLSGKDVLVNGKKIGTIQNDVNDFDSGINFVDAAGTFSKEFDDIKTLYDWLSNKYIGQKG